MDQQPSTDPRLLEMLDCCRPNSRDREDPAFADLAEGIRQDAVLARSAQQIEALDGKLSAAFKDVAVPEGLRQRILAGLAVSEAQRDTGPARPVVVSLPDLRPPHAGSPGRSRRFWLAGSMAAVAAACLLLAIVPALKRPSWRQSEVLDQAVALFTSEEGLEGRRDAPPGNYPFSRDVLRLRGTQWRYVERLLGCGGVAYDLPAKGGSRATLYVLRTRGRDLPLAAPSRPAFNTGDCSVSAWQEGELLYILAVRGDARAYQGYLDLHSEPMAVLLYLPPAG